MATLSKGTLFDQELVKDLINKVKGKSSLAVLSANNPIPFNGTKEFIFSMDKEIDIVAENGKKSAGGISLEPVTIIPIKFEYSARVSDEFMIANEDVQIDILRGFNDGFAAKVAKGLDIAVFHGLNPRTGTTSAVVGSNNFDSKVEQTVSYNDATPDDCIETAIETVEGTENDVSGIAINSKVRSDLAKMTNSLGEKVYPEFKFGGKPSNLGSQQLDINNTVSFGSETKDVAIIGDFRNMFRWGFSKEIPLKVIEYGDPDNSGQDLQGANQVLLRAEIFLGWGILDPKAFSRIITE